MITAPAALASNGRPRAKQKAVWFWVEHSMADDCRPCARESSAKESEPSAGEALPGGASEVPASIHAIVLEANNSMQVLVQVPAGLDSVSQLISWNLHSVHGQCLISDMFCLKRWQAA